MNILIIGNGFDLEHGLPTKYTDFLKFIKQVEILNRNYNSKSFSYIGKFIDDCKIDNSIKEYLRTKFIDKKNYYIIDELISLTNNNFWLNFFNECENYIKEDWIDFEAEISKIIKTLDKTRKDIQLGIIDDIKDEYLLKILQIYEPLGHYQKYLKISIYDNLILDLENNLTNFIRCLEIYLEDCVANINLKYYSPDILDLEIDKVISFNYTDTFMRLYDCHKYYNIKYDFIHGKSNINNSTNSNNMVLGIDEYLDDDLRNKETTFIEFKKYYQRIHKKTSCKYMEWLEEVKTNPMKQHNYIFLVIH